MWIVIAVLAPAAEGAACERAKVAEVVGLLEEVSDLDRSVIAAKALSEVCTGPKGWVDGLADRAVAPPDSQQALDLKVAAEAPVEWMAVCSGGLEPLTEMSKLERSEHRPLLWRRCELGRHGWMTERQWLAAKGPIVIPLVGGHVLTEAGVPAAQVGALVRALAGWSRSAAVQSEDGQEAVLGIESSNPEDRPAGFAPAGRVEPDWRNQTLKQGDVCTVQVFVTPQGTLEDWSVLQCDMFLETPVAAAVEASTFQSGRRDGAPAAGRFQVTYEVP